MSGTDLARGMAIGVVETIPGVSGGTMALVVGVYERLIAQAGLLVGALRAVLPGRAGGGTRPVAELRRLDWGLLVPVALGMVLAVALASQVLPDLIEAHPVGARAVFLGMVAASVAVPLRITGMLRGVREWALVAAGFVVTFLVSGLPPAAGDGQPAYPLIALAAAVAVCALVLPGFSGSFLLLVFGLYEPTLRAVAGFDVAYIAVFVLGAVLGLGTFVTLLQWLLDHHHRTLMVIMVGVLLGALRALWPWQDDARGVLAPDPGWAAMLIPLLLGAAAVVAIMVLESRTAAPAGTGTGTKNVTGDGSGTRDGSGSSSGNRPGIDGATAPADTATHRRRPVMPGGPSPTPTPRPGPGQKGSDRNQDPETAPLPRVDPAH